MLVGKYPQLILTSLDFLDTLGGMGKEVKTNTAALARAALAP